MRLPLFMLVTAGLLFGQAGDPAALFAEAKGQPKAAEGYGRSMALLEQAIGIWEQESSDSPLYAEALDLMALRLKKDGGRNWRRKADPATAKTLAIREKQTDASPEDLALALELRADALGRQASGQERWARAEKIRQGRVAQIVDQEFALPASTAEKVGGEVKPPGVIQKTDPRYTGPAQAGKVQGMVLLSAVIGEDGVARDFTLLRGIGYGLDEKAAEAVKMWRFKPAMKNGRPVKVSVPIEVNFRLL